jgi:N-carbamoylputrescine amidase
MSSGESRDANLSRALSLLHRAVEEDAQMICFPELFSLPWIPDGLDGDAAQLAETVEGPTVSTVREEAKNHGVVVIAPFYEASGGQNYSSAAVIGPDGEILGVYRKVHLPQLEHWRERGHFSPGDTGFPVFATPFGIIGIQLGWDNFFPEGSRILALSGASVIFAPTAAAYGYFTKWDRVLSANAIVNTAYVFRVNRVGHQRGLDFYGRTFCVNPHGDAIHHPAEHEEGIYTADLDLEGLASVRRDWGFLDDRRADVYHPLSSPRDEGP